MNRVKDILKIAFEETEEKKKTCDVLGLIFERQAILFESLIEILEYQEGLTHNFQQGGYNEKRNNK